MFNFEIHITVDADEYQLDAFRRVCQMINAKAIIINPQGANNQVMTSSTIRAKDLAEMFDILHNQVNVLTAGGLKISRQKVECCPKFIETAQYPWHYWEIHVPCLTDMLDQLPSDLNVDWHISRNEFKPNITMLTHRSTSNSMDQMEIDICSMQSAGMVSSSFKHHVEYAIYDTNIDLDSDWMENGKI